MTHTPTWPSEEDVERALDNFLQNTRWRDYALSAKIQMRRALEASAPTLAARNAELEAENARLRDALTQSERGWTAIGLDFVQGKTGDASFFNLLHGRAKHEAKCARAALAPTPPAKDPP